jgi:hypothetical protein
MRDIIGEIIGIFLIVLILVVLCLGITKLTAEHDNKLWNGGHCNICGNTWEYEQAVGHRSSTTYIYVCRKCGKRIEINEVR